MRKLKYHEKKLLKKVNFLEWKKEDGHREAFVMQRYHATHRDDYKRYSGLCRMVQKLVNVLMKMDRNDPSRIQFTDLLLEKLWVLFFFKKKNGAFCLSFYFIFCKFCALQFVHIGLLVVDILHV